MGSGVWGVRFWFVSARRFGEQGVREPELVLPRAGGGHGDLHPPHADANQSADLQQLQPNCAACRLGELGVSQPDPAQRGLSGISCERGMMGWKDAATDYPSPPYPENGDRSPKGPRFRWSEFGGDLQHSSQRCSARARKLA